MAHGYLSYSPVTGEGALGPWLYDKLKKLIKKEGEKQSKKLVSGVKDLLKKDTTYRNNIGKRFDVTGGQNTAKGGGIFGASKEPKGLLAAGKGGLVKREDRESALGKNPINSDKKEGNILGPAGSTGRARKGGGTVDMGGSVSTGLNASSFLNKSGQIDGELFEKSAAAGARFNYGDAAGTGGTLGQQIRAAKAAARGDLGDDLKGDSGADIVAAMAKNTQAIITLVDTTEKQTQSGVNIAEKQAQAQDTLFSRQKASKEEKALEQGEDLSGFMTPEKIMKAIKPPKSKDGGGGGGSDDKKGGGFGFPGMGMAKGLLGKGKLALGKGALIGAAVVTGLVGGMSLGTHMWHQNNDKNKANAPKKDRLGNLLGDDGEVLSGPSAPTQEEQFVDNVTGERYDPEDGNFAEAEARAEQVSSNMQQQYNDLNPEAPVAPGYNQGGLISGGKANLVDDVPIRADEGEVVMSNRAGNMFGRDSLMSMNAVAGSTNTPSSGGGYAQGGTIGVSSQSRKMYKAFGQGIIDAQLDEKKKLAEIQGEGLRNYFETKGGIEKFGEGLKGFFEGLGGAFASLFRGSPDTPGGPGGPGDPTNVGGGGTGEQNLAAFLSTMEASGNQNQADAFQVMLNRTADAKAGGSMKAYGTTLGDQVMGREQFSPLSAAIYGASADSAAAKKYGHITSALGGNVEERKKKLLEIASQPDGLAALQKLFGGGSASDASKVLKDFKSGGSLSQTSAKDIGSMVSFRGYRSGAGDFNRGKGGNFFFDKGSKTGTLSEVSPGSSAGGGQLADAAESLRGVSTKDGPGGGRRSCVFAVNKVFAKAGIQPPWGAAQNTLAAINGMKGAGWNEVGFENAQPGDVWVYDNGVDKGHVGIKTSDGRVLSNGSNSASFSWSADQAELLKWYPDAGGLTPPGGTFYRPPGGGEPQVASTGAGGASPLTADQKSKMFQKAGMPQLAAKTLSAPGPLPAKSASPQTGTPIMATSAQVASASNSSAAPTIINNYYGPGGGQQNGTPTPNSVAAGIGMNGTGLGAFQEAKLRILT